MLVAFQITNSLAARVSRIEYVLGINGEAPTLLSVPPAESYHHYQALKALQDKRRLKAKTIQTKFISEHSICTQKLYQGGTISFGCTVCMMTDPA